MTAVQKPKAVEAPEAPEAKKKAAVTGGHLLKGRYRIRKDARLPTYDSPTAMAYAAEDTLRKDR